MKDWLFSKVLAGSPDSTGYPVVSTCIARPTLFVLPPRQNEIIQQHEVESLLALDNKIRQFTCEREQVAKNLLQRYRQGALVEPGVFQLQLETIVEPGVRRQRLRVV